MKVLYPTAAKKPPKNQKIQQRKKQDVFVFLKMIIFRSEMISFDSE